MVNNVSRTWLLGGWITVLALVVAVSVWMAATLSTTMLLVALGVAPGIVVAVMKGRAAPPTVAEILHTVEGTDSRS
jgi:O-antigen ligase